MSVEEQLVTVEPVGAGSTRVRPRRSLLSRVPGIWASPLGVGITILALWQLAVAVGVLDPFWASQPSDIVRQLLGWVVSGDFWTNFFATVRVALIGGAVAFAVGAVIGTLQAAWPFLDEVLTPYIEILYAVPKVALVPVLLFVGGIGSGPKIVLVFLLAVFIASKDIRAAFAAVDTELTDSIRILGGSTRKALVYGALPQMVPHMFAALRAILPLAWVGAVFTEFFGSSEGLGTIIITSQQLFDSNGMMAAIVVISAVGAAADWALARANDRFDAWRPKSI